LAFHHIASETISRKTGIKSTARSRENETRNGHWNAKQNPNRNQETIVLSLFLFETLKGNLEHGVFRLGYLASRN